ncbi:MAG: polysaccharide biosynthesis/export family protein [Planctomycetia bacterium]|nr:polysaccharide biosynthesis/export family protein [Planctomycetia bacterium]
MPPRANASRVAYRVRTVSDPAAPAPTAPAPAGPQAPAPGAPAEAPSADTETIMPGGMYEYPAGPIFGAAPVAAWPSEFDCPPINGCRLGVQCQQQGACYEMNWKATRPIPWQIFAQGEYIGPHRLRHVPEYRLRVDDQIFLLFRLTTDATTKPYELTVGDIIRVESLTSDDLSREVIVQPDGTISMRLLGQVKVAGRSIAEVRDDLEEQFKKYVRDPSISIAPVKLNSRLEELRASIDARQGFGGQSREVRVTPEGTIQLPGIGSVPAQGLTLMELKREIDTRYLTLVSGFDVTPLLQNRAARYIYVVGEVKTPGRYELVGPTTIMQSIALAGGWNVGGNLDHVVVFRRDSCWQLMATKVEIHHALFGKRPCPADEIWLRDSDIVLVPKRPIKVLDDSIELIFTRGIYGAFPMTFSGFWSLNNTGNVLP